MKAIDAINEMIEKSGKTANAVSLALGKHRNFISSTAYNGSTPRADTLAAIANECGYVLSLQRADDVPDDAILIDR